jgi:uncharacterized protein
MRWTKIIFLGCFFALTLFRVAVAGPLEDGLAAYDNYDYATALKMLEPLADQGNVEAQVRLGIMYRNGRGVPVDYVNALKWYRLAAAQDNAQAQFDLGEMYRSGQGVTVDHAEMVKLTLRSGEKGYVAAQDALGFWYEYGVGVQVDNVKAYLWYDLAAAQGGRRDADKRDQIAKKLTPEQIAEAQRMAREWVPKK